MNLTKLDLVSVPELDLKSYRTLVTPFAREIEELTKIYYLVPIIQSAHESRYGNSGLARNHCNLFGITATDSWKKLGKPIANLPTWEVIGGKKVELKREFRAYPNWRESFQDWAKLITTLSIYKPAYALLTDKNTVRDGIRLMAETYATDPAYSKKLLQIFDSVIGVK